MRVRRSPVDGCPIFGGPGCNAILRHYERYIHGVVVDMGCNHGACTFLAAELQGVQQVMGLDLNEAAITVARQTAARTGKEDVVKFVVTNLCDLSQTLSDQSIDTVVSFHAIEHIYPSDIDAVVAEFRRVLRRGGHAVISIPYDHHYSDPCHVAFYVEQTLSALFERNGFETIECVRDDRWPEKNLLTGVFCRR